MDHDDIDARVLNVTINGTGFAGQYTAACYRMLPHKNGVWIELAGVTSGRIENAKAFALRHDAAKAYESHAEMVAKIRPDIDNIACANHAHGAYVVEAAQAGAGVIVLEKPPVLWPGYGEGRSADAKTRKIETMAYLAEVLDAVRAGGSKLLYAEDFVYVDGVQGYVAMLREAVARGQGHVLYQRGVCAHPGSHAPAYDDPAQSGGGALLNKACHPLGPCLYVKQIEGILRNGAPIRPKRVSGLATQILKGLPPEAGRHFRVMQQVDDFARITVEFEDGTLAEVWGYDLGIAGILNELSITADFGRCDIRINPNDAVELFLPDEAAAGDLLFREKLPAAQGTSFPAPRQFHAHGYVNEIEDAVDCALDPDRYPQSGPMMAWDTMAVLMAAYESSEKDSRFIDIGEYVNGRPFEADEAPNPAHVPEVYQRR